MNLDYILSIDKTKFKDSYDFEVSLEFSLLIANSFLTIIDCENRIDCHKSASRIINF